MKNSYKLITLIFLVLSFCSTFWNNNACAYRYMYDETEIRKKVEKNPENPELYIDLGLALQERGKIEEAIAEYTKSIQMDPTYVRAISRRAQAYMRINEIDKAIQDFEEVINMDPEGFWGRVSYSSLGIIYTNKKEYLKAIDYYQKAIELEARDDYYYGLGIVYMDMGDIEKARELFNKVLSMVDEKDHLHKLATYKLNELKKLESKPTAESTLRK